MPKRFLSCIAFLLLFFVGAVPRTSADDTFAMETVRTVPAPRVLSPGFPSLAVRSSATTAQSEHTQQASPEKSMMTPTVTVCASLAIVLGLFAGFVWLTRRFGVGSSAQGGIPKELIEALGTTSLDARTKITLIRVGGRIIVTAQTAQGIQPLAEITNPEEVREMTAACNGHAKNSFASTLKELEREPVKNGFAGIEPQANKPSASPRRLFTSA